MARPLYEKFVEWVIEQRGEVVTAEALREAAQEWIRRSRKGHIPKLAAERRPPGRQRLIPKDARCQNPYFCANKGEVFGPDGLILCCGCRRRWRKTGSLEPAKLGRPRVNTQPCACGAPATKKGMCDRCYGRHRYATLRKQRRQGSQQQAECYYNNRTGRKE